MSITKIRSPIWRGYAETCWGQVHYRPNGTTYACDRELQVVADVITEFLSIEAGGVR